MKLTPFQSTCSDSTRTPSGLADTPQANALASYTQLGVSEVLSHPGFLSDKFAYNVVRTSRTLNGQPVTLFMPVGRANSKCGGKAPTDFLVQVGRDNGGAVYGPFPIFNLIK